MSTIRSALKKLQDDTYKKTKKKTTGDARPLAGGVERGAANLKRGAQPLQVIASTKPGQERLEKEKKRKTNQLRTASRNREKDGKTPVVTEDKTAKKTLNRMKENSAAWHEEKDPAGRRRLANENRSLAGSLRPYGFEARRDENSGEWYFNGTGTRLYETQYRPRATKAQLQNAQRRALQLTAHGVVDEEETVQRMLDQDRRVGAGLKAVATGWPGSALSLLETTSHAGSQHLKNTNNTEWQKKKRAEEYWADLYDRKKRGEPIPTGHSEARLLALWTAAKKEREALETHTPVPQGDLGQKLMAKSRDYQEEATEGLGGGGKFLANTAMSLVSNAPAIGVGMANPPAGLALMGAQAAGQKTAELNARGIGAGESLGRGLLSGGIEIATEKLPLDNLLKMVKQGGGAGFLKRVLGQMGMEATEESASYALNLLADKAAKDPTAQWSWRELLENAASTGEAGDYYFDANDKNNSWKDRTYTQGGKTFVQSSDRQRMYEVPKQEEIRYTVLDDGTVTLNDDVISQLDNSDYRNFIKAYADLNLVTLVDQSPVKKLTQNQSG